MINEKKRVAGISVFAALSLICFV